MGIIGFIISLIAAFFMLIGLMPFLGWINWFTTLPVAIVGVIISSIAVAQLKRGLAVAGLAISISVICIALGRLYIGGGIF